MDHYVGVDIGGTKMYLCAKVDNEYVEKKVLTGWDCPKEKIKEEIDNFISQLPYVPNGVGIALPGLLKGDMEVALSDIRALTGVTADYFSAGRWKVRLINDVKAATVKVISESKESDTIAVVMAGTGLAVGIYTNQQILMGGKGFAGELGYCMLPTKDGLKTVDSLCGGAGILQQANCSIEEFLLRIKQNEVSAINLLKDAGYYFGICLIQLLHLYNPNKIVIGGTTSTYPFYLDTAISIAKKYALEDIFNCCSIEPVSDPKRIIALGAMEFVQGNKRI